MKRKEMKKNVLLAIAGITLIFMSACSNSFTPEKKVPGTTPADTPPADTPVTANAAVPVITGQPQDATYSVNAVAAALTVSASVSDGGTLSYQWYFNAENSNKDGTIISGGTTSSCTPVTTTLGVIYYYVVVTNTLKGKTAAITSNAARITVSDGTYPPTDETFTIVINISDAGTGDTVTVSPDNGIEGVTATLTYTVADTAFHNLLEFGGVAATIASVDSAGDGTRTYAINAADASNGVITITAVFTHTDLEIAPITFTNTEGHITKTYGDAAFTNAVAAGYKGSGAITYSSSDTTVATVNGAGQVTILKAGSVVITAEKAADTTYAHAQTNYTLTVNPKAVTITGLSAEDTVYYGTTMATVTGVAVISGLVGSDAVTVSAGIAAFADKNVGTDKTVTFSGWSLTGADAGNYTLSAEPESVTADITARTVTIKVNVNNKTYDGTTTATRTMVINGLVGLVGRDTVTVSAGTAEFADKNVDTGKTVTFSGWSLTGADAGNYSLAGQPESVTADITAKPVTITGLSAANKQYDGATTVTITGTKVISGKVNGDSVTVSAGTAAFADKNVGTGKTVTFSGYSLSGADAGNYTLSAQPASVTANITAKALTITGLSAANKQYDGATTVTITGTAVISGVVSGETVTLGGTRTAAFANKNVGTAKAVTVSGYTISGTDAGNYSLTQPALTANITAKSVTITGLSAQSKQYDGTTTATVTDTAVISGKIDGDTVTVNAGTAAFANKTVANNKSVTFSGFSLTGTDAGNYTLSAQPASVTANITAKSVTITGLSAESKFYDGTTTATVTGTATISGKISTDTVTVVSGTAVFANATVGNGKTVTFSGFSLTGADAGNYSLSAQPASRTANIVEAVSMVSIPAGTFTMGSPTTEANRGSDETQHSVTLSGFYMGKYEVTQEQYQAVLGYYSGSFYSLQAGENQYKRPVEGVTWYDTVEFCNKLSVLEGLQEVYTISGRKPASGYPITSATVTMDSSKNGYRLPTEAQWEYACRAGTTTAYNTGAAISDNTGWYDSNSGGETHKVGLKPANAWGLYDMHGNLNEWCWDWYGSYPSGAQTNPTGASASSGDSRVVVRGGDWDNDGQFLRSASRHYGNRGIRNSYIGFRLVRSGG